MGIVQSKTLQNLVVLMEPSDRARNISLKAGNMILNRFCIDEDAAFELSGVNSVNDDLESLFENIRLGKQPYEQVRTYGFVRI